MSELEMLTLESIKDKHKIWRLETVFGVWATGSTEK